jgi:hypothetical protein
LVSSSLGIVDRQSFLRGLQDAERGKEVSVVLLMRTLAIELWLRRLDAPSSMNRDETKGKASVPPVFTKREALRSVTL